MNDDIEKDFEHIQQDYDILVVGGGPAGLAATNGSDNLKTLIIDMGKNFCLRDRYKSADMTQGIGGAGLFSDGKFSFYPSSTNLWSLDNTELLQSSVLWTYKKLVDQDPGIAEFLPDPVEFAPVRYESGWNHKPYPSIYLSLEQREELIRSLLRTASNTTLVTSTKIISMNIEHNNTIKDRDHSPILICTLLNTSGQSKVVRTKYLIFAGGRFGPLDLKKLFSTSEQENTRPLLKYKETFQRIEFGVRIQQETAASFFCEYKDNESQLNDPKFIYVDQRRQIQLRTFCACKDGEVIASETNGIYSASGRADCMPTGVSNIGFNVRLLNESTATEIWRHMSRSLARADNCFELPLEDLIPDSRQEERDDSTNNRESMTTFNTVFGQTASEELVKGMTKLCEKFTINKSSAKVIGPTLEGIGWYPQLDSKLKIEHLPIWVCGDSTGSFRGIVAALISGHYVRSQLH